MKSITLMISLSLLSVNATATECTHGLESLQECAYKAGGSGETIFLTCPDSTQTWYHNGEELKLAANRYRPSGNSLTIDSIIGEDEGWYACNGTNGPRNSTPPCLIVYGRGSYETCNLPMHCIDDTTVSSNGTIDFNLRISFDGSGCLQTQESVRETVLKKGLETIYSCHDTVCQPKSSYDSRWWTTDGTGIEGVILTLHQAIASDRAEYTIQTELSRPQTEGLSFIDKKVYVTAAQCSDPPTVANAPISSVAQTFIIGSQANYSCIEGCTSQGNHSIRCELKNLMSVWPNPPSCYCPAITTSTHATISTMNPNHESTYTTYSIPAVAEQSNNISSERVEIAVIIPVSLVVIVVIVHIIITLFIIIFYRRKQKFRVPFNDRSHVSQNCSVRQSVIEIDVNLGPDETEYEDSKKNSEAIDV